MKKYIIWGMCLVLCLLAVGCSDSGGDETTANALETEGPQMVEVVPTMPPDEAVSDALAPTDYQYAQLTSAGGGLSLDYPATWSQIPGTNTICFVESTTAENPARFTLTRKTLSSTPDSDKKTSQLASFVKRVVADYDSYELSPLGTDGSFLGDKGAYYVTYTVPKDGITLKGYVIMATREKALYVYHFRVNVNDYEAFQSVMSQIRDSIAIE